MVELFVFELIIRIPVWFNNLFILCVHSANKNSSWVNCSVRKFRYPQSVCNSFTVALDLPTKLRSRDMAFCLLSSGIERIMNFPLSKMPKKTTLSDIHSVFSSEMGTPTSSHKSKNCWMRLLQCHCVKATNRKSS